MTSNMESALKIILLVAIVNVSLAAMQVPTKTLNDGSKMPTIALGTYNQNNDQDKARMRQSITWAVEAGYRHIDTAAYYQNERQIGEGVKDVIDRGLVKREDLFITTKLWNDKHRREQVVPALRESLEKLGLDYVDLYLIHFPLSQQIWNSTENMTLPDIDYLETWQGMEEAQKLGLAKSIGVSNFNSEQIGRIIASGKVKPAVNEIEVHPSLTQLPLVTYCQKQGITVMAFSPFGFMVARDHANAPPPRIDDPTLTEIANKYGKTTSQVVLRYLVDRGLVPIPKSTNKGRIEQNVNIFDFKLTPDEIECINKFNSNTRVITLAGWENNPYFPYNKD